MRTTIAWLLVCAGGCADHGAATTPPPGPLGGAAEPSACASAPVYVLVNGADNKPQLGAFDPDASSFSILGDISCPGDFAVGSPNPVVGVDHAGMVYVLYGTCGEEWMYRIDPGSMACAPTPFRRSIDGNYMDCVMSVAFDMDPQAASGETLYYLATGLEIAPAPAPMSTPYYLGAVDTMTSMSRVVGPLAAPAQAAQSEHIPLTGAPDGTLYIDYNAYPNSGVGTDIGILDQATATATFKWQITTAPTTSETSWYRMFTQVHGDFYMFDFSTQDQTGEVVRFRPSDGSVTNVGANPRVLAAGASPCVM